MEVFNAVMRAGSITGAARLLGVSQPAISMVLRHCEDQLKIKLFYRSGGRLIPTPEAEAIYPDISNIFQRIDTVSRMTDDLAGGRLGQLRLAATFPVANGPLAVAVAEFAKINPSVKFVIHALPTAQVVERVARREADIGLGFGPVSDPAVETQVLAATQIACIMPINHPLASLAEIAPQNLAQHSLITYAPNTAIGGVVDSVLRANAVDFVRRVQVNFSMTAFALAEQGVGIALVEPMLLSSAAATDRGLVARPLVPEMTVETLLILPIGRPITRTVSKFIETLKQIVSVRGII